jgi:hypothetical protein
MCLGFIYLQKGEIKMLKWELYTSGASFYQIAAFDKLKDLFVFVDAVPAGEHRHYIILNRHIAKTDRYTVDELKRLKSENKVSDLQRTD